MNTKCSVKIEGKTNGEIKTGLLILAGFENADTIDDLEWLSDKIINLRIFGDSEGKMNLSVKDIDGNILLISQFTLHAMTKKGNRPSFINAAKPDVAVPLYNKFIDLLQKKLEKKIETGIFGADMKVELLNNGPVTIVIDSKQKE